MKDLKQIAERSHLSLEEVVQIEQIVLGTGYFSTERALLEIDRFLNTLGIAIGVLGARLAQRVRRQDPVSTERMPG